LDNWLKDPVDLQEDNHESEIYSFESSSYIISEKIKKSVANAV
jgi:hypothetical protein